MYATISDLLRDLFGFNIPLPIQTFGFFMALSFAGAYWTTLNELKRKEASGLLHTFLRNSIKNEPITLIDFITATIIGAFIGFKGLEMVLDYDALVLNPQGFLLSGKGSWFGALIGGAYAYYIKWKEAKTLEGTQPEKVKVEMHPYELMGNIVAIAAIAGILGAKIFHNLENLDEFMADPMGSLISFSGLTFYGGLIVAAVLIIWYAGKNGVPAFMMMDAAAPGLMLAYGIGRIGCHLSGDGDWGIDNLAPQPGWLSFLPEWVWAYRYPHNVLSDGIPIAGCEGAHCNMLANPVFPTPLYEAIACILLFFLLWSMRKRFSIPGTLFCFYLILNGLERFLIEKIRVNTTYQIFGKHITQAELISSILFLSGIIGWYLLYKRNKHKLA
ncbi:MAG: prolipoprotein diacylglyceryl transferase [Bacteroidia bacterium]|nr:prolipoprotein diacylglyceryl transferase [Bacteroidia bacterium]